MAAALRAAVAILRGRPLVFVELDPGGALYGTPERIAYVAHAALRSGELLLVRALGAAGRWLGVALLACGVASLALRIAAAAGGERSGEAELAVAAWALVLATGIALWIPIARPQYPLPVFLPVCAVQAIGLAAAWSWGQRQFFVGVDGDDVKALHRFAVFGARFLELRYTIRHRARK